MPKNVSALTDQRFTAWRKKANGSPRWEKMYRSDRELRLLIFQMVDLLQLPLEIGDRSQRSMDVSLIYARRLLRALKILKKG